MYPNHNTKFPSSTEQHITHTQYIGSFLCSVKAFRPLQLMFTDSV